MGCIQSLRRREGGRRGAPVVVFVPGMRAPCRTTEVAMAMEQYGQVPTELVERLSALRARIEAMASGSDHLSRSKPTRKAAPQHIESTITDLQLALEDYLPVLLSLKIEGSKLKEEVKFSWINQDNPEQETSIASTLYELLSVLHTMSILGLSWANFLLTPQPSGDGFQTKSTAENRRTAIDVFLKTSGILKCAMGTVIPQMSEDLIEKLPAELSEEMLHALYMQALGHGVEIQLSFAVDTATANLAVKRRLACEQLKCWTQVHQSTLTVHAGNSWVEKHKLFVNWKLSEAKAAAYYFHGLILYEGDENTRAKAVVCLRLADSFLMDSRNLCVEFCATAPATRVPPLWGAMKYLSEKIPKDVAAKACVDGDVYDQETDAQKVPQLPDFLVALQHAAYDLPRSM